MSDTSTKPYLLRALYEWCTDNGFTPHIAVRVDQRTRVPTQFVRDGEIVLNISFDATNGLQMKNDWIEFNARFSGKAHKIEVPVSNVLAIYARENGQGMAFPVEDAADGHADVPGSEVADDEVSDDARALTPPDAKGNTTLSAVPSERRPETVLKSIDGDGAGDGEPAAVVDSSENSGDHAGASHESDDGSDGNPKPPSRPHLKVVK
ncbi:ClpXP protease specificity-enhancing factor [Robbsia sp. KACC 23696]|uniref:ClpXP protease specificity-enhancing factor n=1 Tax=Robbsia sp. KACC 23696 TaxID=3149231 RepID=UPI00325BF2FA